MAADRVGDMQEHEFDDKPYESAEDEDFQPGDVLDSDLSSTSEGEGGTNLTRKRKRKPATAKEGGGEEGLESGDEFTIQQMRDMKRQRKEMKGQGTDGEDEFSSGEDGSSKGFVRTRAMRMRMQEERKPLAKVNGAAIDVDTLWKKMNSISSDSGLLPSQDVMRELGADGDGSRSKGASENVPKQRQISHYPNEFVRINRTYKFAGEVVTEEKTVPKDSAEAKVFMASEESTETLTAVMNAKTAKLRRPRRKLSRFDPNPTGSIQKSWERQAVGTVEEDIKGPTINTVEKSRLDWAAYVDLAGIGDELKIHSRAKEGYLGRMDFLDRVGAKQEEERRKMRSKWL